SPAGALIAAAVVLATFGTLFALHPTARTAHHHRPAVVGSAAGPLVTTAFVVLAAAQPTIGMIFGFTQTGTAVLATELGRQGMAGGLHGLLGVGSVIAGLAVAGLPERFSYERRMQVAAAALVVLTLPLLAVDSIGALIPVVLVLGFAIAPYMISV